MPTWHRAWSTTAAGSARRRCSAWCSTGSATATTALWGGEFLLADYRAAQRLATFKPVALLGGAQAMREPWRPLYAHLMAAMSWAWLLSSFRLTASANGSSAGVVQTVSPPTEWLK